MVHREKLRLAITIAGFVAIGAAAMGHQDSQMGFPKRKEGQWEVTKLGDAREISLYHQGDCLIVSVGNQPSQWWNTKTGKRVAIFDKHQTPAYCFAVSRDGTRLLSGHFPLFDPKNDEKANWERNILCLWDTANCRLLKTFDIDRSAPKFRDCIEWYPIWLNDNTVLLQFQLHSNFTRPSSFNALALFDVATGRVTNQAVPDICDELIIAPDGKRAIARQPCVIKRLERGGLADGSVGSAEQALLVDLTTLKIINHLEKKVAGYERDRYITHAVWSNDSRKAATVTLNKVIKIWDGSTGKLVSTMKGHTDKILSAVFSPDSRSLLTASEDGTARLWEVETGQPRVTYAGHTAGLSSAVFNAKGNLVLTAAEDETARIWDTMTGKMLRAFPGHGSGVSFASFQDGDQTITTITARDTHRTWSIATGTCLTERHCHPDGKWYGAIYFNESSGELWVGPPGAKLPFQWPPKPRKALRGHNNLSNVAVSPDCNAIASSSDNHVFLWDVARWDKILGKGRITLPAPVGGVSCLQLSRDGKLLAVGDQEGRLSLWDTVGQKQRVTMGLHGDNLVALAIAPDAKVVASAGADKTLVLVDIVTGKPLPPLTERHGLISAVAFSPDGKLLAEGGTVVDGPTEVIPRFWPGQVIIWDIATRKPTIKLGGLMMQPTCMAFSSDSKLLAVGTGIEGVKLFNIGSGKLQCVFSHEDSKSFSSLALSLDSRLLATTDWSGGAVRLWNMESGKLLNTFGGQNVGYAASLAFTPDGATFITRGPGDAVCFWEVAQLLAGSQ